MIVVPPNIIWRMHGVDPSLDLDMGFTKTNSEGKEVPDWIAISIVAGFFVCCAALIDYGFFHNPWKNACRRAKKQGITLVLDDAHKRAERVVANNPQCVPLVPEKEARRDSAHYAHDISKFVDKHEIGYIRIIGMKPGTFFTQYDVVLDVSLLYRSPGFRAILANYEKAVQELVAARTAKQNSKLVGR